MDGFTNGKIVMEHLPCGAMLYDEVSIDGGKTYNVAFLIKEENEIIQKFSRPIPVLLEAGLFKINNVMPVVVMLNFCNNKDFLYEVWFNFCTPHGEQCMRKLAAQDDILLIITDEHNNERRKVRIKNNIKDEFIEFVMRISSFPKWEFNEFDIQREELYKIYPSMEMLWNEMGKK